MPKKSNTVAKVGTKVVSFSGEGVAHSLGQLLTVQEAAALLRLSCSSLNKWRVAGRGPPFVRLEGAVRYRLVDLAAYLTRQTRCSTSEAPTFT
jgi:hypothetical protein